MFNNLYHLTVGPELTIDTVSIPTSAHAYFTPVSSMLDVEAFRMSQPFEPFESRDRLLVSTSVASVGHDCKSLGSQKVVSVNRHTRAGDRTGTDKRVDFVVRHQLFSEGHAG